MPTKTKTQTPAKKIIRIRYTYKHLDGRRKVVEIDCTKPRTFESDNDRVQSAFNGCCIGCVGILQHDVMYEGSDEWQHRYSCTHPRYFTDHIAKLCLKCRRRLSTTALVEAMKFSAARGIHPADILDELLNNHGLADDLKQLLDSYTESAAYWLQYCKDERAKYDKRNA